MFEALPRVSVALTTSGDCFADEVAIDFPSVGGCVERMRLAFLGEEERDALSREILVSRRQASNGVVVPLDVPLRGFCRTCGGRGEVWTESCPACEGTGEAVIPHQVQVSLPAGVSDGAQFSFSLTSRHAPPTRIDLRVAIR